MKEKSLAGECDFLNRTCPWINIALLLLKHLSLQQISVTTINVHLLFLPLQSNKHFPLYTYSGKQWTMPTIAKIEVKHVDLSLHCLVFWSNLQTIVKLSTEGSLLPCIDTVFCCCC